MEPEHPPPVAGAGAPPPSGSGAPMNGGSGGQPPEQQAQQPKLKSSVGYAVIAQLVLDALKPNPIKNEQDLVYSDYKVVNKPEEELGENEMTTNQALKILYRNVPSDTRTKLQGDMGQGITGDLDSSELATLTQLGLDALFYHSKDRQDSSYNSLISDVKLDTSNAKQKMEEIRSLVSSI